MAFEVFRLVGRLALDGQNEVEKGLEKSEESANNLSKRMSDMGDRVGKTGKSMSAWVTGPIAGAGAGVMALATRTGNMADRLLDLSAITGMSTDAIQEYQYIAGIAGTSTEAVTSTFERFSRQMGSMEDPASRGGQALGELGISFDELSNATPEQTMDTLIGSLQSVEDPVERARLGTELFGRGWGEIAPIVDLGAEGLANAREEAGELGAVMSNDALNDANNFRVEMQRLTTQFGSFFNQLAVEIIPILTDNLLPILQDNVIPLIQDWAGRITDLVTWFAELDGGLQMTIVTVLAIVASIGPFLVILGKVMSMVSTLITVVRALGTALTFLSANPVGAVILAITSLVLIGIYLYNNWDDVRARVLSIWEKVRAGVSDLVDRIRETFENLKNRVSEIWNSITETIKGAINNVIGSVNQMIDNINDIRLNIPPVSIAGQEIFEGASIGFPRIPRIPQLAHGGVIDSPTLAMVGENPRTTPEIVTPENLMRQIVREEGGGRNGRIEVPLIVNGREFARAVASDIDRELERRRRIENRNRGVLGQ